MWTSLIYVGRGDFKRARQLLDEAWTVSGAGAPAAAVDIHAVVPAHTGMAVYHLFQGDYETSVEYARAGLELADRSGYFIWAIHRLLPSLAEAILGLRELEAASEIGKRMRRDSERLGHRLGLAWSDACDALVLWLSGDLEQGIVGLTRRRGAVGGRPVHVGRGQATPVSWPAGLPMPIGPGRGACPSCAAFTDTFGRIGARRELSRTREMFRELGRPPAGQVQYGRCRRRGVDLA